MPISVTCECGKRTTVGDPLAGKTIRCPGCGEELYIPASSGPPAGAAKSKKAAATPSIHISSGLITMVSIAGIIVLTIVLALVGPVRVAHQWDAQSSKYEANVSDVIDFGLKAYLSEQGMYNPRSSHGAPQVIEVQFFRPVMAMSIPESVRFVGKTNEGVFNGNYHPQTGEVDAIVEYGGHALAGVAAKTGAMGKIDLTGRKAGPEVQAEVKGRKLKLVYPPASEE